MGENCCREINKSLVVPLLGKPRTKTQPASSFLDANRRLAVTNGASQMEMEVLQGSSPTCLPANLGAGGVISSYRTEIAGDSFLLVFQAGPVGFTPQEVRETASGVQIGMREVVFGVDGGVQVIDHTVSPLDQALIDLAEASDTWWGYHQAGDQARAEEAKAPAISAARNLLSLVPLPVEEKK